jgi:hypothetical protein
VADLWSIGKHVKRNVLSILLLFASLASLALSHALTFSFVLPKATRAIWSAHDVFEKNKKAAVSEADYDHAYAFDLRDSTVIIAAADSLHGIAQSASGLLFVLAFVAAYKRPIQPPQRNAGSRPSSGDTSASETPSSLGPRG